MTRHGGDASIADLIVAMDERAALAAIRRRLEAGETPVKLISECVNGIERVGRLYKDGTFFISALIMAGEIFREAAEILIPLLEQPARLTNAGNFIIATVKGDIHDIGKNIATTLFDAHGFHVIDLGVDVAPERVADTVDRHRPDVLGLSCLLTTGFDSLASTITLVRERTATWSHPLPIVIGGAALTQKVSDRVGADGWCTDAARGMAVVRRLLGDDVGEH
ncbi:MAG TPA: cobalamin-dependent protein [Thermoleophilia bacterium]